jgi:hypothetical protein
VLNLEQSWTTGVSGKAMLAVRVNLSKVIPSPQPNRNPGAKPTTVLWRVRVEGAVGKAPARQTWKSESRRIQVRPQRAAMDGPFPFPYKR